MIWLSRRRAAAEEIAATTFRNATRRYLYTAGAEDRVRGAARALPSDLTNEQLIRHIARIVDAEGRRPECYVPLVAGWLEPEG